MSKESLREELESTVAALRSQSIATVAYAVLTSGENGLEPEIWDFGDQHDATMGCQLTTRSGARFTFTWHNTFGSNGLKVFEKPIDEFLSHPGEPWRPVIITVDDHPRWAPLLGREIIDTDIRWYEVSRTETVPLYIRLDFAASGQDRQEQDSVWMVGGSDDVLIVFDRITAERTGLLTL